jgi:hypothetical protein
LQSSVGASSKVVEVFTEKKTRSNKSERMQRVTIYSERDDEPHLSTEQLAETTRSVRHVERYTQSLIDFKTH